MIAGSDALARGLSRRSIVRMLAAAAAVPAPSWARGRGSPTILYVAVGAVLHLYQADDEALRLTPVSVTRVPEAVQYVWFHPGKPLLYAAFSNRYTSKSDDRTRSRSTPSIAKLDAWRREASR